jgi:hypothetical protein
MEWFVNDKLEGIWKEAMLVYFKELSEQVPEGSDGKHWEVQLM